MDNKGGEKFNPFLEEPEDLLIANSKEMEEAKQAAGVVSDEEHRERMLQSGDRGLVRETRKRELSAKLEELQNSLHETLVGKLGVDNLGHLSNLMRALRDYPGLIDKHKLELAELRKQQGGRFIRTKRASPLQDEMLDLERRIRELNTRIPIKMEESKGMLEEMGLAENVTLEEIDKMWEDAEAKSKQLRQERENLREQLQNL